MKNTNLDDYESSDGDFMIHNMKEEQEVIFLSIAYCFSSPPVGFLE